MAGAAPHGVTLRRGWSEAEGAGSRTSPRRTRRWCSCEGPLERARRAPASETIASPVAPGRRTTARASAAGGRGGGDSAATVPPDGDAPATGSATRRQGDSGTATATSWEEGERERGGSARTAARRTTATPALATSAASRTAANTIAACRATAALARPALVTSSSSLRHSRQRWRRNAASLRISAERARGKVTSTKRARARPGDIAGSHPARAAASTASNPAAHPSTTARRASPSRARSATGEEGEGETLADPVPRGEIRATLLRHTTARGPAQERETGGRRSGGGEPPQRDSSGN